jgi:hypothetical protein
MSGIWTQADIDTLKAAILGLASGEKVQTVTYGGPPARSVVYHAVDLPEMRKLLAEMVADVAQQAGGTRYRLAKTTKGFSS